MVNKKSITRRDFMVFSAASASGLTLGLGNIAHSKEVENLLDPGNPLMLPTNFEPTAFFTMEPSGRTTIHVNKCEMGQHIGTAFAQIVCEELELNWDNANIDYPGFPEGLEGLGIHFTAGSFSVSGHFDELSRAGAAGRIADGDIDDHPRPGGDRRSRRPGDGDVRGQNRRIRCYRSTFCAAVASLHPGPVALDPALGRGPRAARYHSGHGARCPRLPAGVPFRTALSAGRRPLPERGAAIGGNG